MRRRFPLGVLVILVLAVVSLPAASASSSQARSSGDEDDVQVIRLTSVTVDEADVDVGEPGDSLGDYFVFTDDLFRDGEKVGILGVVCTAVRSEPEAFAIHCVGTAQLPRGQITVQGLVTFSEATEGEPVRVAITGGTGRFRTAHGVLTIREVSETEDRLTFRVIR